VFCPVFCPARYRCAGVIETGGSEGIADRSDEDAEIAGQPEHLGGREIVAAAAQQRGNDDGEITGAHGPQPRCDAGKAIETEAVLDLGKRAEGQQQAVVAAAGRERGLAANAIGHLFSPSALRS
jgi:hypothetical protein